MYPGKREWYSFRWYSRDSGLAVCDGRRAESASESASALLVRSVSEETSKTRRRKDPAALAAVDRCNNCHPPRCENLVWISSCECLFPHLPETRPSIDPHGTIEAAATEHEESRADFPGTIAETKRSKWKPRHSNDRPVKRGCSDFSTRFDCCRRR